MYVQVGLHVLNALRMLQRLSVVGAQNQGGITQGYARYRRRRAVRDKKSFARRSLILFWVFPRDGKGECFRLYTTRWECDGMVVNLLVDGTGQDYTIFWLDAAGRNRGTDREYSREIGRENSRDGREYGRETLIGMVVSTMGNRGWRQRLDRRETLACHIQLSTWYIYIYIYI